MSMAEIGASSYRRFLLGETDALNQFVTAYSDALVRFAAGYVRSEAVAEDVAAEAIALLLYKRKSFPDEARMRSYLYKTVRSKAMDYLRHHGEEVPLEDMEAVLGGGDPLQDLLRRERDAGLYRCLGQLPQQYREVLTLAYLEDFGAMEICTVMGKRTKQVYNLLARAKTALKELLDKEGITYEDL